MDFLDYQDQTAREDQLDAMRELGVTPSFFAGQVYYWGDRHRDIILGPERASRISPLGSALDRNPLSVPAVEIRNGQTVYRK